MAHLWGREWTRRELERRVGDIQQIAGVRLLELADGKERGVRAAQFRTGTGFTFMVLLDRGMDVSQCEHSGRSLCWRSMTEDVHPAHFEEDGLGFVRSFFGGMLVTCGLNWAGAPCRDSRGAGTARLGPRDLNLHGRISHTPAKNAWADGEWEGDEYRMWLRGKCQESIVFGENLVLHREISARLGENSFEVRDRVENAGFEPVEFQILYHINTGFPVLDAGSRLLSPSVEILPRDGAAEDGLERACEFDGPEPDYAEKCYFHRLGAGPEGETATAVVNPALGLGVYVRFNRNELPCYTEWKMLGERNYVAGMEPANCLPLGRVAEREAGRLQYLAGRETREIRLTIGVLTSAAEIAGLEAEIEGWRAAG